MTATLVSSTAILKKLYSPDAMLATWAYHECLDSIKYMYLLGELSDYHRYSTLLGRVHASYRKRSDTKAMVSWVERFKKAESIRDVNMFTFLAGVASKARSLRGKESESARTVPSPR